MARLITELTAAGEVQDTDLLWIEQGGLPRKIGPGGLPGGEKIATSTFDPAGAWYRIAECVSGSGRGAAIITVSNTGTSGTPAILRMRVSKSWQSDGSDLGIQILGSQQLMGIATIEQMRVTHDTTAGEIYVEVFIGSGAGTADWYVGVRPELGSGTGMSNWNALAFTAGATADFTETINFLADGGYVWGFRDPSGSRSETYFNRQGQLFLKADLDDSTETDNPFIRMEQDGNAVSAIIGLTGTSAVDAQGNTFTDGPNNSLILHENFAGGSIAMGVNGQMGFRLDDSDFWYGIDINGTERLVYSRESLGTDGLMRFGAPDTDIITGISVGDTRNTDQGPDDYDQVFAGEFKELTAIGITADGTYTGMLTMAPWTDGSGGMASQLTMGSPGMYFRASSMGNAAWETDGEKGVWRQVRIAPSLDDDRVTTGSELAVHYPQNAGASIDSGAQTNRFLKITLPFDLGQNNMHGIIVKGFDYDTEDGHGGGWAVAMGGYPFGTGWVNTYCHTIYGNPPFITARFWNDTVANNCGFALGLTTDDHEYPKAWVDEVFDSFHGNPWEALNWTDGITVEWATAETNMTFDTTRRYLHKTQANGRHYPAGRIYPQVDRSGDVGQDPANITGYIDAPTLRGSINVGGQAAGSYAGYGIENVLHFMSNGTSSGIYDEGSDQWRVTFDEQNNVTGLWAEGVEVFLTQDHNANGNTSGAQLNNHNADKLDVGFNQLALFNINATDTLEARHCGAITGTDNTTAYTLTLGASGDTDFPVEGVVTVVNGGTSGDYTITEGASTTLYYVEPGTGLVDTTGGCTIGPGGTATIWRRSTTEYWIWGSEISFTP